LGVVTFLFTDVEGSTRRWAKDPDGMRLALAAHDEVLRGVIEAHAGFLFKHTGDGMCAAFSSPKSAVDAAVAAQRALQLPVRMGVWSTKSSANNSSNRAPSYNSSDEIALTLNLFGVTADQRLEGFGLIVGRRRHVGGI
jgi:hypothetical protein